MDHVLVTGAAGAIGGAVARELAALWPSAKLTLVDVDEAGLARAAAALGARVTTARWDLSRPDDLEAAWTAAGRSEPIDCLVNCAGIMDVGSFVGTSWRDGNRVLAIDLIAPLRLMNLAVPDMVARGRGVVVNVTSMAGRTPLRGCSYYGAAKAGLAMASEIARLELAPKGVRVVTVYPGPVASSLERNARAGLRTSRLSKLAPVGDPDALGRLIARAVAEDRPRVVYPGLYAAANRAIGLASWATSRFSPEPLA